jgi:hypothetical protein
MTNDNQKPTPPQSNDNDRPMSDLGASLFDMAVNMGRALGEHNKARDA